MEVGVSEMGREREGWEVGGLGDREEGVVVGFGEI